MMRALKIGSASILALLGAFTATAVAAGFAAHASTELVAPEPSLIDLLKPVYEAFAGHRSALGVALGMIALIAIVKRNIGDKLPWLHTDAGGSLLALLTSSAAATATGLAAPDATVTFDLIKNAVLVGVGAAGGYAMIKHLVIEPLLPHLPAWAQAILSPVLWIFDGSTKPAAVKIAEAVEAGAKAVAAAPAQGIAGIVGAPTVIK